MPARTAVPRHYENALLARVFWDYSRALLRAKNTIRFAAMKHSHSHQHGDHHHVDVQPAENAKYYCPMCEGVVSDQPGDCPKCGMTLERNPAWVAPAAGQTIYACPMHPQIEQDHPGACPICGMALEPKTAVAGEAEEENAELRDMTRRLWIGASLALPVFLFGMAHFVPAVADMPLSRWVQFLLSTPVVLWAGWPFFVRGAKSLRSGHWNMFTLIALGDGAAWLYSLVAFFLPGWFPAGMKRHGGVDLYFEAASVIIVLVLVGQVLELRALERDQGAPQSRPAHRDPPRGFRRAGDPPRRGARGRPAACPTRRACAGGWGHRGGFVLHR